MWKIAKPKLDALVVFDTCRSGVRNANVKKRLLAARPSIGTEEAAFDAAASSGIDHLIPSATYVGEVSSLEMENLYDRHMVRDKSRGRYIYDRLMMAAVDDMCPFCGHRDVSTLDHTLPKAQYPALAVTPLNLIPCCKDCNHRKGDSLAKNASEKWLNAYYDDVTADRWLYANIVEGSPPIALFFVAPPDYWDGATAARVKTQFKKLDLNKLYASQSARQFQNSRHALKEIYESDGPNAVRKDLVRRYMSCQKNMINSWEGALYQAASSSDWFCTGGFES